MKKMTTGKKVAIGVGVIAVGALAVRIVPTLLMTGVVSLKNPQDVPIPDPDHFWREHGPS